MKRYFPLAGSCLLSVATTGLAQEADRDEHHELEEIVVSAMPIERTVEQLAQPSSIVDTDELARRQSASIGESIAGELGVSATYFGPVASRPVIRGQYGERVTVLSNGLDSLDASALSEDHAVSTDTILAERVEIVRGPATLLYGSGAAGGIVNVVDSRIHEAPAEVAFGGAASLGVESATGKRSGAVKLHVGGERLIGHVDYFRRDTDDVEIPGFTESAILRQLEGELEPGEEHARGKIENTDSEAEGGAAALSWVGDRGFIGLSVSGYETNYGVPGHAHEEEHAAGEEHAEEEEEFVRIDLDQTRYDVRGSLDLPGFFSQANLKLANNKYEHIEVEGAEIGTVYDNDATDVRLDFRHQADALSGALGLQYKTTDFEAIGDEAFVPPSKTDQLSVFLFEDWMLNGRWVLQGSARAERQEISVPGAPGYDDTAFGASVGAIVLLNGDVSLSGNLSVSERHPNSTELYADGPHVAVQRFERGTVSQGRGFLDKELSTNLDITLRGHVDTFQWSVTGFYNRVSDYVLLSPTAETIDGFQVFDYQQADADLWGYEAEVVMDFVQVDRHHLDARVFSDYVRAEERDTGRNLPRIPPLRFGVGLHYTYDKIDAGITAVFHDEQDETAEFELPTDEYTMLTAEASYRFADPEIFVFIRGTNLLDEDARRHASPLKDIAPLPGRSVSAGLRWDF